MRFETSFVVPGTPAEVLERFADAPSMASLFPGASLGEMNADGSYPAALLVSFGPKRITFNGVLTNQVDRATLSGVLTGRAAANMRAAKMAVKMTYTMHAIGDAAAPSTRVELVSDAELTGVLADFAETGGRVVTEELLKQFAQRFAEQSQGGTQAGGNASEPVPISGTRVLGQVLRSMLPGRGKPGKDSGGEP